MGSTGQRSVAVLVGVLLMASLSCVPKETQNSLAQHTGEPGSTVVRTEPPYHHYPNTAGNIVAPPGNPAGNPAGSPPIINGTENQSAGWPAGR